jgi:hypothetical protein
VEEEQVICATKLLAIRVSVLHAAGGPFDSTCKQFS